MMYYRLTHEDDLWEDFILVGSPVFKEVDLSFHRNEIGTNVNDIYRSVSYVEYNDGENSWVEEIVYEAPRDWRIVVWEGSSELSVLHEPYRILSLKDFNDIKSDIYIEGNEVARVDSSRIKRPTFNRLPHYYRRRVKSMNSALVASNEDIEYVEKEYGVRIKHRKRVDVYPWHELRANTRPRKSWKVEKKARQWM